MPRLRRHRLTLAMLTCCVMLAAMPGTALPQDAEDVAYSRKGADTCLACHQDPAVLPLFRGKHAVPTDPRGPFGSGQLQCEACHGPGGQHAARVRRGQERPPVIRFGSDQETSVTVQNDACLGCHSSDVGSGWHAGPHDTDEVACADCHDIHAARDAVLQTATQPDVCYGCHQLQRSETSRAFAHPLLEGKMDCGACHSPHGDSAATQLVHQTLNDTCYQCHAEKRGPYLWEHAPVSEDCTACHTPHGSNHPGMLTRRAPLLCQGCHSQSGHPSIVHDADGLPTAMPSPFLLGQSCLNCHAQVHGSNHPSGSKLLR